MNPNCGFTDSLYQLVDDILHRAVKGDVVEGVGLVDHHLQRQVGTKTLKFENNPEQFSFYKIKFTSHSGQLMLSSRCFTIQLCSTTCQDLVKTGSPREI